MESITLAQLWQQQPFKPRSSAHICLNRRWCNEVKLIHLYKVGVKCGLSSSENSRNNLMIRINHHFVFHLTPSFEDYPTAESLSKRSRCKAAAQGSLIFAEYCISSAWADRLWDMNTFLSSLPTGKRWSDTSLVSVSPSRKVEHVSDCWMTNWPQTCRAAMTFSLWRRVHDYKVV